MFDIDIKIYYKIVAHTSRRCRNGSTEEKNVESTQG